MRNLLLAVILVPLSVTAVVADPARHPQPDAFANSGKMLPVKGDSAHNPCASYGPGFAKVDGSDTCMRIGGTVSIGAGSSVGSR